MTVTGSRASDVVAADLDSMVAAAPELDRMAGKELLITGGAGFLGYYLVQLVVHRNRLVPAAERTRLTIYDNYARGVPAWLQLLAGDPAVTLVEHDVRRPLPADAGDFEYVVHAAGIASPIFYRQRPLETIDANVNGLRTLLEHCRERQEGARPVEGFLFFSSSEIYGDPSPADIPTPETYRGSVSCTGPRACYDESKRFGETLCVTFARQYGLPVTMARPFNNYGPGLKITDRRVLPDFARDLLAGRDHRHALGRRRRREPSATSPTPSSATTRCCWPASAGEAYNVGVEEPEISVAELAHRVAEIGRRAVRLRGARRRRERATTRTTWSTTRTGAAR